jgi:hypothetical protein
MFLMLKKTLALVGVFIPCLLITPTAYAATYQFSQGGYSEGAIVTGTFTVNDSCLTVVCTNPDFTYFSMSFSGNSQITSFSLDLDTSPTETLSFTASEPSTGEVNFFFNMGNYNTRAFSSRTDLCGNGNTCGSVSEIGNGGYEFTTQKATISSVPVPAAAWLFGSALIGLGAIKRKSA